jgi:hypothetical protein
VSDSPSVAASTASLEAIEPFAPDAATAIADLTRRWSAGSAAVATDVPSSTGTATLITPC